MKKFDFNEIKRIANKKIHKVIEIQMPESQLKQSRIKIIKQKLKEFLIKLWWMI